MHLSLDQTTEKDQTDKKNNVCNSNEAWACNKMYFSAASYNNWEQ